MKKKIQETEKSELLKKIELLENENLNLKQQY